MNDIRRTTGADESGPDSHRAKNPSIAVVGCGPRGTSVLERIAANMHLLAPDERLDIHVIDPYPAGAGRVWRHDQSRLLWSNTRADECTLFTDDTVTCQGPAVEGPTLEQWARDLATGRLPLPPGYRPAAGVREEAARVHAGWFATRQLTGDYLAWSFWRTAAAVAPRARVRTHRALAVSLGDLPDGRQRIHLDDGGIVDVDLVILAQGHFQVKPQGPEPRLSQHAAAHHLTYQPTAYTSDISLDAFPAGEPVLMRGFGLTFIDIMVLLTEGRGGRFQREPSGELCYLPSGREPTLYVGSRRGVPYRSKFAYVLPGPPPRIPRYFSPADFADHSLDFASDLWPALARELTVAGYRELAHSHPRRLTVDAGEFLDRLDAAQWQSPEFKDLIEQAVPDSRDHIDVDGLDRPLATRRFSDAAALRTWMLNYLADDLERGRNPRYSAHLAVYHAIFSISQALWAVVQRGEVEPGSGSHSMTAFFDFCRFRTSGPPGPRLEQLLALARAGVVDFVGANMKVTCRGGVFEARTSSLDRVVQARALIEARLPGRALTRVADPLLLHLIGERAIREQVQTDPTTGRRQPTGLIDTLGARPLGLDGSPHPRRFVTSPGDFPRPRTNDPFLHQSDAVAREALQALVEAHSGSCGQVSTPSPIPSAHGTGRYPS
ncbi:FAD/NAD(P)-binding protein [Streptomyces sp. WG5]|uniref:FAD/NAD(P)-binding protein n=1 Tax=Streptomyces sp. WG5 TaxID=3417648 RepID=UPI003CE8A2AE